MGKLQESQGVIPLPAKCPSQAIVDVSENMRAKIYALFCKIGKLSFGDNDWLGNVFILPAWYQLYEIPMLRTWGGLFGDPPLKSTTGDFK